MMSNRKIPPLRFRKKMIVLFYTKECGIMSDKLTVWTAAKEVSTAVGTMVNTYKTLRTVKKQESIILKEKIRAFQTIARARGMGEVARANIDEIAKIQNFIDQLHMDGAALDYAMSYMDRLNDMLNVNLEGYMNGL